MIRFALDLGRQQIKTILCLGSHCDDIEIGCGGTIIKLARQYPKVEFHWVVFSSTPERAREATECANLFLGEVASSNIIIKEFRNGYFPYFGSEIKDYFEQVVRKLEADVIFTHSREDLHQDHRLVGELTWNTFRDHLILEYEIPKYDGDLGRPNVFVSLQEEFCREKVETIIRSYSSQSKRRWFHEETFLSLLRLRGVEAGAPTGLAEAFVARKISLGDLSAKVNRG